MRGALCVATRLYILYLAADESISGWEFLLLIPKSPQRIKGKVEQSREKSSVLAIEKLLKREPLGRPRLRSPTLLLINIVWIKNNT